VHSPDTVTSQLQQYADRWCSILGQSDEQVANQIREDQVDILMDLTLHTAHNRLLVFARKPAPVQVTYLAYCGSSGMSTMDYRLSDPHLDPLDTDLSCYTEATLRLPRTYWCYLAGPSPTPCLTPAIGNGFVTFGCLNNFAKVSIAALDLWARILLAVPGSRMIIHASPGQYLIDVTERFARVGVEKSRVHFVGRQLWSEYAQTYSQIDIALDPFPYGGGITTCDALWMGVPVVTLSGNTAVGRGGRSILSNIGLPELIAFTPDQYVQIAIDLARDCDRMDGYRQGMRARMLGSPLLDGASFARDVEAAYRQMWRTWCETVSAIK
jgi:predicted O-linked N-acetylglucosamine transferase (SPINDLY family)